MKPATNKPKDRLARDIGPQQVGGRYHCGYWNQSYTVEHIGIGADSRIDWSDWSITCRWDDGRVTTHCTAGTKDDRAL